MELMFDMPVAACSVATNMRDLFFVFLCNVRYLLDSAANTFARRYFCPRVPSTKLGHDTGNCTRPPTGASPAVVPACSPGPGNDAPVILVVSTVGVDVQILINRG